jgi:hypothetical protein
MKKIYVAGCYSADNVIDVLANIRKGIHVSAKIMCLGFAVFCPWLDFQIALTSFGKELTKRNYQDNSMAWVEVSDAVFVLPHSEKSNGVKRELDRARSLGIPIFDNLAELTMWGQNETNI